MTARRVDRPWWNKIPHQGRRSLRAVGARPSISGKNNFDEIACSPFQGFLQSIALVFCERPSLGIRGIGRFQFASEFTPVKTERYRSFTGALFTLQIDTTDELTVR
jgi:hypothetical protein